MPAEAVALAETAADDRAECGTEVDAHVEDCEAGVATRIVFAVHLADDGADVRFQQPGAEHDQHEAEEESLGAGDCQHEVAGHDDDAAKPDRALCAQQPVGNPAAWQRDEVDGGRVQAIDRGRRAVGKAEPAGDDLIGHEQHQQRPHAVVAETLPHFREEQRGKAARMAHDFAFSAQRYCIRH